MKRFLIYTSFAALALMFSCQSNDSVPTDGRSGVKVKLSLRNTLSTATKAIVEDTYQMTPSLFSASIVQDDKTLYNWENLTSMPEIVYLAPGDYKFVLATNGVRSAINEVPYYYGETPFTISTGSVVSINAEAAIQSLAVSVTLAGDIVGLTGYRMVYFNMFDPDNDLFSVTEAQNTPTAKRVYIDSPFPYGIRIEGRLNGLRWVKNVIQYQELQKQTYHNITVK